MSSAFRLLLSNCLNWKINCDDHSSLSSTTAVQKWIISYTSHHFTPHGRYELNKLTSLPMCGFIAQLVEQRTGNAEVTGSNPVEALIFFRLLLSNCLSWKIYCDDHSSLSPTTAVQKWIILFTSHQYYISYKILQQLHDVLEQLKTNFHKNFRFKRVLGFVIEYTLEFLRFWVTRGLHGGQESCHVG